MPSFQGLRGLRGLRGLCNHTINYNVHTKKHPFFPVRRCLGLQCINQKEISTSECFTMWPTRRNRRQMMPRRSSSFFPNLLKLPMIPDCLCSCKCIMITSEPQRHSMLRPHSARARTVIREHRQYGPRSRKGKLLQRQSHTATT